MTLTFREINVENVSSKKNLFFKHFHETFINLSLKNSLRTKMSSNSVVCTRCRTYKNLLLAIFRKNFVKSKHLVNYTPYAAFTKIF